MQYSGVKDIPTFEDAHPTAASSEKGGLGNACGGKKIETCRSWFDAHSKNPIGHKELAIVGCFVCRE